MSAQVETTTSFQPFRQGNHFTLTLRGHWAGVPNSDTQPLLSVYNPDNYAGDNIKSTIRELAGETNFNYYYDSFYAPVDFKFSGLGVVMPVPLAGGLNVTIKLLINGSVVEQTRIPEEERSNEKQFTIDCDFLVYEDDFVEIRVEFSDYEDAVFNNNNIVFSIGGCIWYGMYKELWADVEAEAATTEAIALSGVVSIDGFTPSIGDTILVKNQATESANGLYDVASGAWTRTSGYANLDAHDGVVIYVRNGDTQLSDETYNYTLVTDPDTGDKEFGYPLLEDWEQGDKWFKTNIELQNRSGNEEIRDRVFVDIVKSPVDFLLQGLHMSVFRDYLMVVDRYTRDTACLFFDLMVNGRSILPLINFPRPISVDLNNSEYQSYDIGVFNDEEGYPIRFGDELQLRFYQKNKYLRMNGLIIQSYLYGCSPDCAALDNPLIAIYEPCEKTPCVWKYSIQEKCEPTAIQDTRFDPTVSPVTPAVPEGRDFVTVDSIPVTINGVRIWI